MSRSPICCLTFLTRGPLARPIYKQLGEVRDAAEKAISDAKNTKDRFGDAINWGDLRCVRVMRWVADDGDTGLTVEIEEVDPGAVEFCAWIAESIEEELGVPVDVVTGW